MSTKRANAFIAGEIVIIVVALWISRYLDLKLQQITGGFWPSAKVWTYLVAFLIVAAPLLGLWQVIFTRWWPKDPSER
jgi:protein-S-isoprenylcysteine O-methyltransferase Ste14